MNAIVPSRPVLPANPLMPTDMRTAMDLANMMATAKLVPAHLQGKPGDCLLVIEQSMRWGMSPFAVAQATSVIGGKLMFEGKLVSAAINASGILSGRMTYDYDGEGASRAVTASATIRGEQEPRSIRCTLVEAKTTNALWQKQPDQQLAYFSTRAWARRHAPEVMLGVYAPEEFDAPPDNFHGPTIEAKPATIPSAPTVSGLIEARTDHRQAQQAAAIEPPPKRMTAAEFLDSLQRELDKAPEAAAVEALMRSNRVSDARSFLKNGAADQLRAWTERAEAKRQALADDEADWTAKQANAIERSAASAIPFAPEQPAQSADPETMPDPAPPGDLPESIQDWPMVNHLA